MGRRICPSLDEELDGPALYGDGLESEEADRHRSSGPFPIGFGFYPHPALN